MSIFVFPAFVFDDSSEAVLGTGIVPAAREWVTAQNAPNGENESGEKAAFCKRLKGVGRAGRCKPAAGLFYR